MSVETATRRHAPIRERVSIARFHSTNTHRTCACRRSSGTPDDVGGSYSEPDRASISLALARSLLLVYSFTNKLSVPGPPGTPYHTRVYNARAPA